MSLLEFATETVAEMKSIASKDFAKYFIQRKIICYHRYHGGLITSSAHGIDFFQNIIKFWNEPETYCKRQGKAEDDYEYNFVILINKNKA